MMLSVIVAFYKNLPFLEMVFKGLERQTCRDFEVIVAEDDDNPVTVDYLQRQSAVMPFRIKHVSQKDDGFRKDEILNKAVAAAANEFLVFLDGDCIPHHQLLKEYQQQAQSGTVFAGRRVMVPKKLTQRMLERKKPVCPSLFSLAINGAKYWEEAVYLPFYKRPKSSALLGCNWGIYKKHLIEVNGFDEDFVSPGVGEDLDLEWRLRRSGLSLTSMRHRAIVYHLHHDTLMVPERVEANYALMKTKQEMGEIFCANGLNKHLSVK